MSKLGLNDPRFGETLNTDLCLHSITFIIYLYTGYVCTVGSVVASDLSVVEYQDSPRHVQATHATLMLESVNFF